jgi:hypothetical protein
MITHDQKLEISREEILEAIGYDTESLNCADASTAIHEPFEEQGNNPVSFIELFIDNCSIEEFTEIKKTRIKFLGD